MISVFGAIWLICLLFSLNDKYKMLFMLLLSTVIQSSYIFLIGKTDVSCQIVTCLVFIIRYLPHGETKLKISKKFRSGIIWSVYLLIISIVAPIIFNGRQVKGITNNEFDFNTFHVVTIHPSISNVFECITILLYVCVAIILYNRRSKYEVEKVDSIITNVFYFVIIVGTIHVILMALHLPTNIYQLLIHNEADYLGSTFVTRYQPGIGNLVKFFSTFYEASYCGSYLAVMLAYFTMKEGQKHRSINIVLCIIFLILNLTSTGLATAIIFFAILLVYRSRQGRISKKVMIATFVEIIFGVAILVSIPSLREKIFSYTVGKKETGSFALRTMVDAIALEQYKLTYGVGLGVNSIECYSLIPALLAQTGTIGFLLFFWWNNSVLKVPRHGNSSVSSTPHCFMLMVSLISQILAVQALNYCVYWMCIWILMITSFKFYNNQQVENKISLNK